MSGARDTIRNRRRNSSVSTNGFHHLADHFDNHNRMPHTLEESEYESGEFLSLKASSSQTSSSTMDLSSNGKRKTMPSSMSKTESTSNFFSKNASSTNLASPFNDSCDSENPSERKSLPEKVNFAATWVSAKLMRKARERRARRVLETEKSESSLRELQSELERLSPNDLTSCRVSLNEVMKNSQCLRAFNEFVEKEHSGENLSFWLASEEYRKLSNRTEKALEIHEKFIKVSIVIRLLFIQKRAFWPLQKEIIV